MPLNVQKLSAENFYKTTVTEASGIAASGDVNFTVASPPSNTRGFIIVSPDNISLREVMYYHNVIGNRIYVRAENRYSPKSHSQNEYVQINDVAEFFNYFSEITSTTFWLEKTGGLTVKAFGGPIIVNDSLVSTSDTTLTLTNNATNYVWFKPSDLSINSTTNAADVTAASGTVFVDVVCASGIITSISYRTPKASVFAGVDGSSIEFDGTTKKLKVAAAYKGTIRITDLFDVNESAIGVNKYLKWDGSEHVYSDGPVGPQGPIGLTGATGPQGPDGPQGPQGDPGISVSGTASREVPSGTLNASNVTFSLTNTPISNTLHLYLDGILMKYAVDYTVVGNVITFTVAPVTGQTLVAYYYY